LIKLIQKKKKKILIFNYLDYAYDDTFILPLPPSQSTSLHQQSHDQQSSCQQSPHQNNQQSQQLATATHNNNHYHHHHHEQQQQQQQQHPPPSHFSSFTQFQARQLSSTFSFPIGWSTHLSVTELQKIKQEEISSSYQQEAEQLKEFNEFLRFLDWEACQDGRYNPRMFHILVLQYYYYFFSLFFLHIY